MKEYLIHILFIFKMDVNQKYKSSVKQTLGFYLCGSIGIIALLRNTIKLQRYYTNYKVIINALAKFRNNFEQIQKLKDKNIKENALLETVFPIFPKNYFRNTEKMQKYSTKIAKFYEDLECDSNFEGTLRNKGKQYSVLFQMNRPSVGFQLVHNALRLDSQGMKFHRNQMIAVYGDLSYSKDQRRYIMKAKLLGLDWVQIQKFNELKLIATIISTFYFSILVGISLSICCRMYQSEIYNQDPQKQNDIIKF